MFLQIFDQDKVGTIDLTNPAREPAMSAIAEAAGMDAD